MVLLPENVTNTNSPPPTPQGGDLQPSTETDNREAMEDELTLSMRLFDEKELEAERTLAQIAENLRTLQHRLQLIVEDSTVINADIVLLSTQFLRNTP